MEIGELLKLISRGETQEIEFKKSLTRDITHEVVAMANSGGGWILIGVTDKGEIIGCDLRRDKLYSYLQQISPPVKLDIDVVEINGKKIYVLRVYDDGKLHSIGGLVYIRVGTVKRPLDLHEIGIRLVDTLETYFDKQISPVKFKDVDEGVLKFYFDRLSKVRNRNISREDWVKYLRSIGAVVENDSELYLSYGGLLFFYQRPEEYIPYSGIRIVKMGPDEMPLASKEIYGPIWKIAEEAMKHLDADIREYEVVLGVRRERIRKYPLRAIREAVVNALTHRNYAISSDIIISIYNNRLVVSSPGSLVPGVDLENPVHIPRNPVLSQLMYDTGYIEKYGVGILLMKRLCREHPYTDIEFKTTGYTFKVIFKISADKLGLDEQDNKIIKILIGKPSTSREIARELGITKQAVVKRLNKLIELGLVERVGKGWRTLYKMA